MDTSDPGEYVGASVKSSYKGKTYGGTVEAVCRTHHAPKWTIRFSDGYVTTVGRRRLNKMFVYNKDGQAT